MNAIGRNTYGTGRTATKLYSYANGTSTIVSYTNLTALGYAKRFRRIGIPICDKAQVSVTISESTRIHCGRNVPTDCKCSISIRRDETMTFGQSTTVIPHSNGTIRILVWIPGSAVRSLRWRNRCRLLLVGLVTAKANGKGCQDSEKNNFFILEKLKKLREPWLECLHGRPLPWPPKYVFGELRPVVAHWASVFVTVAAASAMKYIGQQPCKR